MGWSTERRRAILVAATLAIAAGAGHCQIADMEPFQEDAGLTSMAIDGLARHDEPLVQAQHLADAFANERMVVGDEDAVLLGGCCGRRIHGGAGLNAAALGSRG